MATEISCTVIVPTGMITPKTSCTHKAAGTLNIRDNLSTSAIHCRVQWYLTKILRMKIIKYTKYT
jgi:hypothetical protein